MLSTCDRDFLNSSEAEMRMASAGLILLVNLIRLKSASVCWGVMPQSEIFLSFEICASIVAVVTSISLWRRFTDVSELLTRRAPATAIGPAGVEPMLFLARLTCTKCKAHSERAKLQVFRLNITCVRESQTRMASAMASIHLEVSPLHSTACSSCLPD